MKSIIEFFTWGLSSLWDMFTEEGLAGKLMGLLTVCFILMVVGLVFYITDAASGSWSSITGVVQGKSYTPRSTHTGVGTTGKHPVVTTSSTSEKWNVIFTHEGQVHVATASPSAWVNIEEGQEVLVSTLVGGFSGNIHQYHIAK